MYESSPLVSIILPTFNRSDMLCHALNSVLAQSYRNLEVIIVDDHSSDDTSEVVKRFNDPRITYVRNEHNLKLPSSLNRGFAMAKGDLMTWTSDDNMYAENALQQMVGCILQNRCDFVFADYFHFSESEPQAGKALDPVHIKLPDTLQLAKCNQVGACFLYSRKVYEQIGDYDADLFLIEDYDYFIRAASVFEMVHIAQPLYYFRRHDDSLYCSRYFEVKAADLLVRYKNRLLERAQVTQAAVNLVLDNVEMLKSAALRRVLLKIQNVSFRMTQWAYALAGSYFQSVLAGKIAKILERYDKGELSFRDSRDQLVGLLSRVVNLEYRG